MPQQRSMVIHVKNKILSLHRPSVGCLMRWMAVVLLCGLVMRAPMHVQAQFPASPVLLSKTTDGVSLINGIGNGAESGISVQGVGDVNGDNMDDFVVGAHTADQVYLLFGRNASTPWQDLTLLTKLDGTNGVTINGPEPDQGFGWSVAGVQDVNGDQCNDVLIGTRMGNAAFLVFGVNGTWPAHVNLTLNAFNGVTFMGTGGDRTGDSVSAAGDVNGDGMADIAIGVRAANTPGGVGAGRMDVLYGRKANSSWPPAIDLPTYVDGVTGFSVLGEDTGGKCGHSVAGVGDVNEDGVDDVAVGCIFTPNEDSGFGMVVVVFGTSELPRNITSSQLDGTNGFAVVGQSEGDQIGHSLAGLNDVNMDGLDDFAIGAPKADANSFSDSGEVYVLYGRKGAVTPWPARLNVSSVDGNNGFVLAGTETFTLLGQSVTQVGDVNGDGHGDFLVGAIGEGHDTSPGFGFLLYGRSTWPARQNITDLDDTAATTFRGQSTGDQCGYSVAFLGDVNGDHRGDLAIGCPFANADAGQTAVVFGPLFTASPTTAVPTTTAPTTTAPTMSPNTAAPTSGAATTTASPSAPGTASPTPGSTCTTQGTFVPSGAACVNGVLVTAANTTVPPGATSSIATSITITSGSSFAQPSGSTLVFSATGSAFSGQSTLITVLGGGCAAIDGDAVVNFEGNPSNADGNTGSFVLVTADCVMGKFGAVTATTSFEGDECVAVADGQQQARADSLSVSFDVSNTCDDDNGLSTWVLVGIIAGGAVVVAVVVIVLVKLGIRARNRRSREDVKMMHMRAM